MTKKDYQAIARAIHDSKIVDIGAELDQWLTTRDAIADILATDNPRFDRARFMEACETGRCKGMGG